MTDPVSHLEGLDGASLSVLAREQSGGVLASRDPDRALAPASNTKLVTSALALDVLGPDYRFETRAEGYGDDLYLVGSGAPDLGVEDLAELARGVAEEVGPEGGEIRGDLVLDGGRFGDGQLGPGWTWGDEQHYYGARSSALALEKNLVTVEVTCDDADPESADFEVSVAPDTEVVAVETDLEVGEEDVRIYTDHRTGAIRVEGSLPAGSDPSTRTERAPVVRPERHCGAAFREALAEAGVAVAGEIRFGTAPDDGTISDDGIAPDDETIPNDEPAFSRRVKSAPVSELIREMNVPSDNFVAEQLARAVASQRGDGSWDAWSEIATDFLESCGVGACRIRDGSGLSRYNLLTAEGLVALLERAHEEPWAEAFFDSLPAPGEGTLENRLGDVSGVRAKTGTITGTCALSGVIRREDRPDVVFSMIYGGLTVEADEARERQDEFVRALV